MKKNLLFTQITNRILKMRFLLLLMLFPFSLAAQKQNTDVSPKGFMGPLAIDWSFFGTTKQHDMQELGLKYNVTYEVIRGLKVAAHFENSVVLKYKDDTKRYFNSNALAGGIGYAFASDNRGGTWEARGFVGHSVGNVDWKNMFYSAEVVWKMRGGLSPMLSLGFTHKNSNTSGIPNMNMMHASLGIAF